MANFAPDHASALADVQANGAAVTFTKKTQSYNAETGEMTPTTTTVAGHAIRTRPRSINDQRMYEQLGLVESDAPMLLFVPTTFGDRVELGATVPWGGETYTVRNVDPLSPDGNVILSKVVVSQ